MTRPKDDPHAFGNQLSRLEFDLLDRETLIGLIRKINDKSQSLEERDDAKNRLLLAHARLIYGRVFGLTGGRIGIDDRQSELFDDAFAYLKERFSEMADAVETRGISLTTVVSQRLVGWVGDKIRRSDGRTLKRGKNQEHEPVAGLTDAKGAERRPYEGMIRETLKRGKNQEKEPVTALADAEGGERRPDEEMIREETLAIIKANVFDAVAELDGLEQTVIVCRFAFNGGDELLMQEVADLLGMTLIRLSDFC